MNELEKEFIPYTEVLALKELGFDEPCFAYRAEGAEAMIKYTPNCVISAPTFSQAFRFFRKKYNCHHTIQLNKKYVGIVYSSVVNFSIDEFDTYEEAELECIKKLIEIVKNK
jgi:hypothetical protein